MMIIETPDRRMVVDTCIGNDKTLGMEAWANMQRRFLDNLRTLGYDPDSIDTVLPTHLHVDHVGWNRRKVGRKWVATFKNARYVLVESEFNFWRETPDDFGPVFEESVQPVFDAALVDLVKSDHQMGSGV